MSKSASKKRADQKQATLALKKRLKSAHVSPVLRPHSASIPGLNDGTMT